VLGCRRLHHLNRRRRSSETCPQILEQAHEVQEQIIKQQEQLSV
jgi:hypothetical protein